MVRYPVTAPIKSSRHVVMASKRFVNELCAMPQVSVGKSGLKLFAAVENISQRASVRAAGEGKVRSGRRSAAADRARLGWTGNCPANALGSDYKASVCVCRAGAAWVEEGAFTVSNSEDRAINSR